MKGWIFGVFIGAITYVFSDLVLTIIECYL